ncbi:MAG: hypothetical protein HFJ34_04910 [Clostridia bacterium]|nr:hypothetical protein [Clostridia bacterium]
MEKAKIIITIDFDGPKSHMNLVTDLDSCETIVQLEKLLNLLRIGEASRDIVDEIPSLIS